MKRVAMVAVQPMKYGTRHLVPGDDFQCKPLEARVLRQLKRATDTADAPQPPTPSRAPAAQPDDLDALRGRYEAATGRKPDRRWRVPRLSAEIEALARR